MLTSTFEEFTNHRVLVVDDNPAIHEDISKVLAGSTRDGGELDDLRAELFGVEAPRPVSSFQITSAYQGREALALVEKSVSENARFAVAFIDMRMPPGWDGLETTERLWAADPYLQIVICTAYSDHTWSDIAGSLGARDGLVLKKPFDSVEVRQMAQTLSRKWSLHQAQMERLASLDELVRRRTREVEVANEHLSREIEERQRMEGELRLAQKLEAVGQLAAGIAHEINTPIQYVGDSVHFLHRAFKDVFSLLETYRRELPDEDEVVERIEQAEDDADLEFLREQVPKAFERVFDGTDRVATIVRAMKEFAHPQDYGEKTPADLNNALKNTVTVARNEYKYVADLQMELGEIAPVSCYISDLNQVFLNLIVNAAHAISDLGSGIDDRGTITVRTRQDGDDVVVEIEDTGGGIPEAIQGRIFDPFFTTKEVGRGTGQGLAISRAIVVEKHGGKLDFVTEAGRGTTFFVRLHASSEPAEGEAA